MADEVPDLAELYELHQQNQMGEAQGSEEMSDDQVFWMEGVLSGANLTAITGAGNPKKIIELKANAEDEFSKNINFWGEDLALVPDNLLQYRGYRLQVGYTNFLPTGRKHPMKVGVALILCNEKGELPPLPAQPEPQTPAPATYTPDMTQTPDFAATPNVATGPPPVTNIPGTPPVMAVEEPVVRQDESSRVESMVRQACFKGAYSSLHATNLSDTQIRHKLEYWTDWAMLKTQRVSPSQHRKLEAKIAEAVGPDNRKLFCEFLVEEANCSEMMDSGTIHLTDMSSEHAEKICGEWWKNMISVWPLWKQEKDKEKKKENDPDVAPAPQSPSPPIANIDKDVPEFMKK